MDLLCFSDIHSSRKAIEKIVRLSASADVVIGAGDFCNMHHGLQETIQALSFIETPAIFVPGNSETAENLLIACEPFCNLHVLHGNGMELLGKKFYGVGGGIPVTPFGSWSWDFTEDQGEDLLKGCPEDAILITHSPPRNCLDLTSKGQHVGSEAIRNTIERKSPLLCVCGHVHESGGQISCIGNTTVVNAGPEPRLYQL